MKTVIAILLAASVAAFAESYANVNTGEIVQSIPKSIVGEGGAVTFQPTLAMLKSAGWRIVDSIETAPAGWVADTYSVVDGAGGHCTVAIATKHDVQAAWEQWATNSWDANTLTNAQAYRRILRAYQGNGAETNANITEAAISLWMVKRAATLTASNLCELMFVSRIASDTYFRGLITNAMFWKLIP